MAAIVADHRPLHWFWIDNRLIDHYLPAIGSTGLAIYALLARHANTDREAFPSLRRLEQQLCIARNTLLKYLDLLEMHGLIKRQKRTARPGDSDSNLYILLAIPHQNSLGGATIEPPSATIEPQVVQPLNRGGSTIEPELDLLKKTSFNKTEENPPLSPQGDTREANVKKSATPRRQKTPFPTTPEAQATLRSSILDTAFTTWYAGTGLQDVLGHPDLSWQWEQFTLDAQAHGRVYASWRQAFMKWLGSKYQERVASHPLHGAAEKESRTVQASKNLIEEIRHDSGRQPLLLPGPRPDGDSLL